MDKKILQIIAIALSLLIVIVAVEKINIKKAETIPWQDNNFYQPPEPERVEPKDEIQETPNTPEPVWTNWPAVRTVNNSGLGKVLSDIESHMPAGHIYRDSDKITWGHETTHGINSNIRNAQVVYIEQRGWFGFFRRIKPVKLSRINGFYCLNDKAVVIQEPNTTIRNVAAKVPGSLRGDVYRLYLGQQAGSWNDTPLYLFDEWSAYTNGSEVRLDLKIQSRAETVKYMLEFDVYAMTLASILPQGYDDKQFKAFLMWQIERTMRIYKDSLELGDCSASTSYLNKLRTDSDADGLRQAMRKYLGEEWCKKVMEF